MNYSFTITLRPVVNYTTKAAEVSAEDTTDLYNPKVIIPHKHLGNFKTIEEAQESAQEFCQNLMDEIVRVIKAETLHLQDAKP